MARTVLAQLSATLRDSVGLETPIQAYELLDPTMVLSDVVANWGSWAAIIDGMTDAQIVRGRMLLPQTPSGLKSSPAAGSRLEQCGLFRFSVAASNNRYSAEIPAIAAGILSGDRTELGELVVLEFLQRYAPAHTAFALTNEEYQELTAFVEAFLSYRKIDRARLARTSRVG